MPTGKERLQVQPDVEALAMECAEEIGEVVRYSEDRVIGIIARHFQQALAQQRAECNALKRDRDIWANVAFENNKALNKRIAQCERLERGIEGRRKWIHRLKNALERICDECHAAGVELPEGGMAPEERAVQYVQLLRKDRDAQEHRARINAAQRDEWKSRAEEEA